MAEEKEVLLEVKDLNVTYGSGRKAFAAVQNANFQIYKGETFGLVGESGSGKTTIGRAILRILPTSGGEILYKGQKINGRIPRALDKQITREIQMIFQDPQSSLNERAARPIRRRTGPGCGRLCWTWACCRNLLPAFPTNFPAASGSASALLVP